MTRSQPAFHLHHHHLDGDDRVVDQQAERDDERAERDALEVPAHRQHHHRDARRAPAAPRWRRRGRCASPGSRRLTAITMIERLHQRALEFPDGVLHRGGLVGDALQLHAVRQLGLDLRHRRRPRPCRARRRCRRRSSTMPSISTVLAVVADGVGRRILVAARDGRDVAELDRPAAGRDRHVADVVLGSRTGRSRAPRRGRLRVSIEPAGSIAFWLLRLSAIASGVMPSAARRSCENST